MALLFAAGGPPAAFAAKAATPYNSDLLISAVGDPVEIGLVPSLNEPGGNITGMAVLVSTLGAKRIELAKDLVRNAGVIGYLLNPSNAEVRNRIERCAAPRLNMSAPSAAVAVVPVVAGKKLPIEGATMSRE